MERLKKNILELTNCTIDEYHHIKKLPLKILADNVRSAMNIGSVLRTADAFLVEEVIMAGISPVPPSSEISKTALGAEISVAWRYVEDAVEETSRLKKSGVKVYVLEQTHNSISLDALCLPTEEDIPQGILLVIGNEVKGVDQKIVDMADAAVEIPMKGTKHSLNVSVSAGIALWEFYKQMNGLRGNI